MSRTLVLLLLMLLSFAGCSKPVAAPSPSISPTQAIATASATPQPPPPTPSPTVTNTPEATTVVFTPTSPVAMLAVPTHTLSDQGPWGVLASDDGLWVMQADGSGLTKIGGDDSVLALAGSPAGPYAAFITHSAAESGLVGYSVNLLSLPAGEIQTLAGLDLKNKALSPEAAEQQAREVGQALSFGGLAWSPDGQYLAFVSPQEGGSTDVYVYALASGAIRRLTDNPTLEYHLTWSPDSQSIFYTSVTTFGTGEGAAGEGAWVVSADGQEIYRVMEPGSGGDGILGWVSDEILLVWSWRLDCGLQNLRTVHFKNGKTRVLWPSCIENFVYDPAQGEILLANSTRIADFDGNEIRTPGLFLVTTGQAGPRKLSEEGYHELFPGNQQVAWYAFKRDQGLFALGRSGQVITAYTEAPYNTSWPGYYLPELGILFMSNLEKVGMELMIPGKGLAGTLPFYPDAYSVSPLDPNLIFFSQDQLYALRVGEGQTLLVSSQVQGARGIEWVNQARSTPP